MGYAANSLPIILCRACIPKIYFEALENGLSSLLRENVDGETCDSFVVCIMTHYTDRQNQSQSAIFMECLLMDRFVELSILRSEYATRT